MSLEVRRTDEGLELELTGEWVAQRVPAIESGLAVSITPPGAKRSRT